MEMDYQKSKTMIIVSGAVAALFGLLLLTVPGITIASFVWIFAGYLVVFGIVRIIQSIMAPEGSSYRLPWLVFGSLAFFSGLGLFLYPQISVVVLAYIAAFYALALGVAELAVAFAEPKTVGKEILLIGAGILSILFAIYMFVYPLTGLVFLIAFLGWYNLIYGIILVIYGITRKSIPKDTTLAS